MRKGGPFWTPIRGPFSTPIDTKLKDWLIEQGHGATITSPLLLIDDEADNASINTAKDPGATTKDLTRNKRIGMAQRTQE